MASGSGPQHLEDVEVRSAARRGRLGEKPGVARPPGKIRHAGQERRHRLNRCREYGGCRVYGCSAARIASRAVAHMHGRIGVVLSWAACRHWQAGSVGHGGQESGSVTAVDVSRVLQAHHHSREQDGEGRAEGPGPRGPPRSAGSALRRRRPARHHGDVKRFLWVLGRSGTRRGNRAVRGPPERGGPQGARSGEGGCRFPLGGKASAVGERSDGDRAGQAGHG